MLETLLFLINYFSNLQDQLVWVTHERIWNKIFGARQWGLKPVFGMVTLVAVAHNLMFASWWPRYHVPPKSQYFEGNCFHGLEGSDNRTLTFPNAMVISKIGMEGVRPVEKNTALQYWLLPKLMREYCLEGREFKGGMLRKSIKKGLKKRA